MTARQHHYTMATANKVRGDTVHIFVGPPYDRDDDHLGVETTQPMFRCAEHALSAGADLSDVIVLWRGEIVALTNTIENIRERDPAVRLALKATFNRPVAGNA